MTSRLFWQHQDIFRAHLTQALILAPILARVIRATLTAPNSGFDLKFYRHSPNQCIYGPSFEFYIDESAASDFPEAGAAMPSDFSNSEVSDAVHMY